MCVPKTTDTFVIPDSVVEIGAEAFKYCEALAHIAIPKSVTVIGERAFSCCTALTSVEIPDSVTEIGKRAFSSCLSLERISIPAGARLGEDVFKYCTKLKEIIRR